MELSTSESLKSSFLPLLLLSSLSSTRFFSSWRLAATDALTAAATSLSSSSLQDKADFLGQTVKIIEQLCLTPALTSLVSAPMTVPDLVLPTAEKAKTNPPLQYALAPAGETGNIHPLDLQILHVVVTIQARRNWGELGETVPRMHGDTCLSHSFSNV